MCEASPVLQKPKVNLFNLKNRREDAVPDVTVAVHEFLGIKMIEYGRPLEEGGWLTSRMNAKEVDGDRSKRRGVRPSFVQAGRKVFPGEVCGIELDSGGE